jgi:hypothetical protein
MLDDYTKAKFPLDVDWPNGGCKVRLYGAIGGRVIGAAFRAYEVDGELIEDFSQSLDWDGQGLFGGDPTEYESMHLPPPPAVVEQRIIAMQDDLAIIRARLDQWPDAPDEWRKRDLEKVERLERQIAQLKGDA